MKPFVAYDEAGRPLERENTEDMNDRCEEVMLESVPRLEEALRQCILAAFEELKSIESVKLALKKSVVFEEIPVGVFKPGNPQNNPFSRYGWDFKPALSDREKLPALFYWKVHALSGAHIYVLKDTFLTVMGGFGRGATAPYTIVVNQDGAHLADIEPIEGPNDSNFLDRGYLSYLVDAVDTGSSYPCLVTAMYKKSHGGSGCLLYKSVFDEENHAWKDIGSRHVGEEGEFFVCGFHYDRESQEMDYTWQEERFGDVHDGTLNVGEWVRKSGEALVLPTR